MVPRGVSRSSHGEDIPLARRAQPPRRERRPVLRRLKWLLAGSALVVVLLVPLLNGPLRGLLAPTPVPGLEARLSPDGRLLGHFPYPEAGPQDLVSVAPGLQLRPEAARELLAMQADAAREGIELELISAFRDRRLQRELFFDVKSERLQSAPDRARVSAPPGFSEHSTGFAVDLGDARRPTTHLSTSFETTPAYRWLEAHAARHHFHLSFPRDNAQGVNYEPWHWRYEGTTEALQLFEASHQLAEGDTTTD